MPTTTTPGAGSGGVSAEDAETLKYLKYNESTNEIEATRTIATEPATIKVGNHGISSMGENFGFTNLTDGIVWSPSWTGMKPQSVLANQGQTGIIPPTFRHYTSDLFQSLSNDPAQPSGGVDYYIDSTLPFNLSISAQTVIVAEDIGPDDWLRYEIRFGTNSDPVVYLQVLSDLTLTAGDTFKWDFDHPLTGRNGQQVNTTMSIAKGSQDAEYNPLQVRAGADAAVRWGIAHVRTFSDEDVMSGVLFTTESQVIRYAATYAVDTSAGVVTLDVDAAIGYKSFVVFDADQNFNQNSCIVDFGGTQGAATLQSKNDGYMFYWDGAQWRYLDLNTKNGGIV